MQIETATVTLGDEEFIIRAAPHTISKKWRPRFMDEVKPYFDRMAEVSSVEFDKAEDLLQMWPILQSILIEGIDNVFELLIAYSPDLAANRDAIEQTASDKQILAAFQEVLRLSDFLGLFPLLGQQIGRMAIGTSSSSPSANGASVTKKRKRSPSTKQTAS